MLVARPNPVAAKVRTAQSYPLPESLLDHWIEEILCVPDSTRISPASIGIRQNQAYVRQYRGTSRCHPETLWIAKPQNHDVPPRRYVGHRCEAHPR